MRTLSAGGLAALDSGQFTVRCLLKVVLPAPDDPFCIWDDIGTISVDGDAYVGRPGRFTVQPSSSAYDQSSRAAKLTLSALDYEVVNLIEGYAWHQSPVLVRRAVIATELPAVLHLLDEFSGYLDQMVVRESAGGLATVEFLCETDSRELSRSGARTRSDADQRERDAADGFFSFSVSAVTTAIDWGRAPELPQKPKGIARLLDKLF